MTPSLAMNLHVRQTALAIAVPHLLADTQRHQHPLLSTVSTLGHLCLVPRHSKRRGRRLVDGFAGPQLDMRLVRVTVLGLDGDRQGIHGIYLEAVLDALASVQTRRVGFVLVRT